MGGRQNGCARAGRARVVGLASRSFSEHIFCSCDHSTPIVSCALVGRSVEQERPTCPLGWPSGSGNEDFSADYKPPTPLSGNRFSLDCYYSFFFVSIPSVGFDKVC